MKTRRAWWRSPSALSLTAGCATRRTAERAAAGAAEPTERPTTGSASDGDASGAAVPGSRADFLQSVPADRVFFDIDSYALDGEDRVDAGRPGRLAGPQSERAGDDRGPCRRARHPRIQSRPRRPPRQRRRELSRSPAASRRGRMTVISWGKERPGGARLGRERLGPEPPRGDGGAGISRNVRGEGHPAKPGPVQPK